MDTKVPQKIDKATLEKLIAQQAAGQKNGNPELPSGVEAITPEDKPKIRAFGKALSAFIYEYATKEGKLEMPILLGGFDYVYTIVNQRMAIIQKHIAKELLASVALIDEKGLSELIEEPFQDVIEPKPADTLTPGGAVAPTAPVSPQPEATVPAATPAEEVK